MTQSKSQISSASKEWAREQMTQPPLGKQLSLSHTLANAKFTTLDAISTEIQENFQSLTWFTYRRGIEKPLKSSEETSDAGWGCMLRTGQMLLF